LAFIANRNKTLIYVLVSKRLSGAHVVLYAVFPWLVVAGLASLAARLTNLNFWPVFAITIVAMLINGWVATLEDDLTGGFINPDGTATPRYAVVVMWVLRGIGMLIATFCVVAIGLWLFDWAIGSN
jgi:hypothetical protein